MKSVNIALLKNQLSSYLNEVRLGQEVLIRDRMRPIAKIVPLREADDLPAEELALVTEGKLRLLQGRLPESFWSMPAPRVARKRLLAALKADRDED